MSQQELLVRVIGALERVGAPYFISGSVASSYHGEPRATHDVDLVVELAPGNADRLAPFFPDPEYYYNPEAARQARRTRGMFNILDVESGDKVDCWTLTDSPFDRSRFSRRVTARLFGRSVSMQSAEDTILSKLLWMRESGGSEKQRSDIRAILDLHGGDVDRAYVERWVRDLGLHPEWRRCGGV